MHIQYFLSRLFSRYSFLIACSLSFFNCERQDTTVIDSSGVSPSILSGSISPESINTDTVNIGSERKPEDLLQLSLKTYAAVEHVHGPRSISNVNARIFDETSFSPLGSAFLKDDGLEVDSKKDDGIYSGILSFSIQRSEVGKYRVELNSEDPNGYKSNTLILTLLIVRENHPPSLSNLQAPDTVRLSAQVPSILLTVRASDPDGLADIRQVTFNSFLPSGQPSSGNPFRMYDDETNGDALAGDGIYSLRIAPPSNTGIYRFEFQAVDRSNASSNIIIHMMTVLP